jgi:flagellin
MSTTATLDVTTADGAKTGLANIDAASANVAKMRTALGAYQSSALQASATALQNELQNTASATSSIRDTDFASETVNLTKQHVLMQSGVSALASANLTTQLVTSLLRG